MSSIREELLMKAQRDTSKLVKVQRMVSRRGKTFPQFFWVMPSQVKATDKVVGGQQNLLPTVGSVAKPAAGVLDKAYLDSIKSDKTKALAYIKSCGLTWTASPHDGVNWMRAMMAVKSALGGQNSVKVSAQGNSQATTNTTTTAQSNQGNQTMKDTAKAAAMITPAIQADLDSCKNGKEKVVVLKKHLGQDKCMEYAKLIGVTWNEHSMAAINNMRMSMALAAQFDTADGTVSPVKTAGPKGKAGAPKGNKNAQKDGVKQEDNKPEPPKEDIDILPSFTPRQKALAEMLNKTTSAEDLRLFKSTGIIAEDDAAKTFIKNNLYKAYYESKKDGIRGVVTTPINFAKESAAKVSPAIKGLPTKTIRQGLAAYVGSDFSNMSAMLYPRDTVPALGSKNFSPYSKGYDSASEYTGDNIMSVLSFLDDKCTKMSSEDGDGNLGYEGWDSKTTEAQFQKFGAGSIGTIAVIQHIADSDSELASEAQNMIQDYQDMLTICHGNSKLLRELVGKRHYSFKGLQERQVNNVQEFESITKLVEVMNDLKSKYNLSQDDIDKTIYQLSQGYSYSRKAILQRKDGTPILDSNRNEIDVYDILKNTQLTNKSTGGIKLVSDFIDGSWVGGSRIKVASAMLKTGKSLDNLTKDDVSGIMQQYSLYSDPISVLDRRDETAAYAQISEQDYLTLQQKILSFSGQKLQRTNAQDKFEDCDISKLTVDEYDDLITNVSSYSSHTSVQVVPDKDNPQRDAIIANLMNIGANLELLTRIHDKVPYDCPNSKANDNGDNYTANFNFYSGGSDATGAVYRWGNGPKTLSSTEVNAQVSKQIEDFPVMTLSQHKQLREFTEKNGYCHPSYSDDKEIRIRKAKSYKFTTEASIENYKGTPVYDLLMSQVQSIAKYCPQMKTARVKTDSDVVDYVNKKLEYTPYVAPTADAPVVTLQQGQLKQLREETFAKVHCSLKSADASQRDSIETRVKHDWDKEKRDVNGKRLYGHITCKFNGVYQIRNSAAEEVFQKTIQNMPKTPPTNVHGNSYETKVVSMFHGTDFRGACGIVGVDGKFRAPTSAAEAAKNGQKYAGGMLGQGVYLADLAGKSAGYFGNWGSGYNQHGALLICNAVLGDHLTAPDSISVRDRMDVDSVSMKAGTNTGGFRRLRADEWCVRKPEYVSPQFIVDAEALNR